MDLFADDRLGAPKLLRGLPDDPTARPAEQGFAGVGTNAFIGDD